MSVNEAKTAILNNKTALGIDFGSTRIKAVLVDDKYNPIASGSYEWENRYENGVWMVSGHTAWRRSGKVSRAVTRIWQKMFRKNMEWSLQA